MTVHVGCSDIFINVFLVAADVGDTIGFLPQSNKYINVGDENSFASKKRI